MKITSLAVLFTTFCLFSFQSHALDCSKALTKTEKLICGEFSLIDLDKNYNSIYSQAMKALLDKDRDNLKNKIKNLLQARDDCVKSNQKFPVSKTSVQNILSDGEKSYQLKEDDFIKGCIATWYNSVSKAIKLNQNNPDIFTIPSAKNYLDAFNKLNERPYYFSVSELDQDMVRSCKEVHKDEPNFDCSYMQNQFSKEFTYQIFFPTSGRSFIQIINNSYSYNAGAAHGQSSGSSKFITKTGVTEEIDGSAYSCSIPIKDPIVISGSVYIPEQTSFTKFFDGILGEFSGFQCYACSGSYHADCLMRLRKVSDQNDSYVVFNSEDFTQDPSFGADKIAPQDYRKCALEILKKHRNEIGELKNIPDLKDVDTLVFKDSAAKPIIDKIKKGCQKYNRKKLLNKAQCLKLSDKSPSFDDAMRRIYNLKMVSEFLPLLRKDNAKLTAFSYNPEFSNGRCNWSIRLHENHGSHTVFWKEFLVEVNGDKICEMNAADDSCREVK